MSAWCDRLSLNTMTTKGWTLREAVEATAAAGLLAIGVWRDRVDEAGVDEAAKIVRDNGLRVSTLCRGGFLTGLDDPGAILDDNRRAIDEAAALGTSELVMVVGGLAGRDLVGARARVAERLADQGIGATVVQHSESIDVHMVTHDEAGRGSARRGRGCRAQGPAHPAPPARSAGSSAPIRSDAADRIARTM